MKTELEVGKRYIIVSMPLITGEYAGSKHDAAFFKNLNRNAGYIKGNLSGFEDCYPFNDCNYEPEKP